MSLYKRYTFVGVNVDLDPIDVADNYWTESGNMTPVPGRMIRSKGYKEVYTSPLFAPYYLQYAPQLGAKYWIYAGTNNVGLIDPAGNHTDITPPGLTQPVPENGWSGGNLNGLAVINSNRNNPFYWFSTIGATALELPGLRAGTRYNVMRPFKYHLIGLGVVDGSGEFNDALHWSDAADPGQIPSTWVPAADNEAGDNILSDEDGAIIDGERLRDSFFIYKEDSVYEMTYVGGSAVFRFRKVFGTTGVLTRNCIARVKGTHVVLGNGDIYQHDGQNMQSIADAKVRRTFFETVDSANYQNSFVVYNEPAEEVWFCVPTTGNSRPNLAVVWNVTTREWGYRTLPDVDFAAVGVLGEVNDLEDWDTDPGEWNQDGTVWVAETFQQTEESVLIADAIQSKLYAGNTGVTADGVGYTASVGRLGLDMDDPQREKAIRRIWPRINSPQNVTFTMTLFNQRDPQSPIEQLQVLDFSPGTQGVAVNSNARYLGVRITGNDSVDWNISGIDIEYMPRGEF